MGIVDNLDQLRDYFYQGTLMFTDDTEIGGIDNRLISVGLRLDMEMSRPNMDMWYLKRGGIDLIRYHPVTRDMGQFQAVASEGLVTRIDFLAGKAPLIYDVSKSLLDAGFCVGVPNMGSFLEVVSLFRKQRELYVQEKSISL